MSNESLTTFGMFLIVASLLLPVLGFCTKVVYYLFMLGWGLL